MAIAWEVNEEILTNKKQNAHSLGVSNLHLKTKRHQIRVRLLVMPRSECSAESPG